MTKNFFFLICAVIALLFFSSVVLAQDTQQLEESVITPEANEEIDPYVLFWPVVAGKTSDEPLYFLKSFKEKVQGLFLFQEAKKGEYEIVLATKRLLEAEKLMNNKKGEHALKTFQTALAHLKQADDYLSRSKQKDVEGFNKVSKGVGDKLSNINKYLPVLQRAGPEYKSTLDEISAVSQNLSNKLQ